jgi:hypothetical protein
MSLTARLSHLPYAALGERFGAADVAFPPLRSPLLLDPAQVVLCVPYHLCMQGQCRSGCQTLSPDPSSCARLLHACVFPVTCAYRVPHAGVHLLRTLPLCRSPPDSSRSLATGTARFPCVCHVSCKGCPAWEGERASACPTFSAHSVASSPLRASPFFLRFCREPPLE